MRRRTRFNDTSAKLVEYLVTKHGFTQNDIAAILNVDKSFVSCVRAAEREFSTTQMSRIAEKLGVPLGAMLIDASPTVTGLSPELQRIADLCEKLMRTIDASTSTRTKTRRVG